FLLEDESILVRRSAQEALEKIDPIFINSLTELSLVNTSCESCKSFNLVFFAHQDKLYCGYCQSWQSINQEL
ncbi:MAG: hypothetical protein ACFFBD_15640, partial [Candidatus Hodarchaeota archaeon]